MAENSYECRATLDLIGIEGIVKWTGTGYGANAREGRADALDRMREDLKNIAEQLENYSTFGWDEVVLAEGEEPEDEDEHHESGVDDFEGE